LPSPESGHKGERWQVGFGQINVRRHLTNLRHEGTRDAHTNSGSIKYRGRKGPLHHNRIRGTIRESITLSMTLPGPWMCPVFTVFRPRVPMRDGLSASPPYSRMMVMVVVVMMPGDSEAILQVSPSMPPITIMPPTKPQNT